MRRNNLTTEAQRHRAGESKATGAGAASSPTTNNPQSSIPNPQSPIPIEQPLRTDGPTLEEYVAAGYSPESYPPQGYAARPSQPTEPKPFCDGLPTRGGSLCALVGCVTWMDKTSPLGQWTYKQCANPQCGKIVEVKPSAEQPETSNPKPETL